MPKRNLILAAAAASLTLAVVAVVLAGPSVSACYGRPEGLAACLRQRVVDFGLLPRSGAEAVVAVPQQAPVTAEPEAAPAAVPPAAANTQPPALTLLRAEPDGSLVIAGTGRPGAGIVVYADGAPLGVTQAEASGDWVVVPDAPLAPGGVEIAAGEAGGDRLSQQSFVVVIDPDRASEPLVIASKPGEASAVLQGLPQRGAVPVDEPAPLPEADPAEVSVALAEPERAEPTAPAAAVPAVIVPPSIDAIEIDGKANFFAGSGAEGATVRLYVDDQFVADARVAEGRWLVEATDVLTRRSQHVRVDMLKPGTAEVAARAEVNFVVDLPVAEPKPQPAEAPPAPPPVEVAVAPAADPSAGARSSFEVSVAAAAMPAADEPPMSVAIAPEAAAAAGVGRSLSATAQAVLRRPADRDLPVAAEAEPSVPPDRDLAALEAPAPATPPTDDPEQAAKEARHAADKAPITPPIRVRPPVPEHEASPQSAIAELPAPETISEFPSVIELAPPGDEVPTLRAVPVGDPEARRFASGKAIIRRGDNLWSIARRVYGTGLKFTTIYKANKDQIRNPSRIYPGQVFDLPLVSDE